MYVVQVHSKPTQLLPWLQLQREIMFFYCSHNLFFLAFVKFGLSSPNYLEEVGSPEHSTHLFSPAHLDSLVSPDSLHKSYITSAILSNSQ